MADLNLALLIFLVVFLTQLVAWVGKSVLQELVRDAFHLVTERDGEGTGMDCAARTAERAGLESGRGTASLFWSNRRMVHVVEVTDLPFRHSQPTRDSSFRGILRNNDLSENRFSRTRLSWRGRRPRTSLPSGQS